MKCKEKGGEFVHMLKVELLKCWRVAAVGVYIILASNRKRYVTSPPWHLNNVYCIESFQSSPA